MDGLVTYHEKLYAHFSFENREWSNSLVVTSTLITHTYEDPTYRHTRSGLHSVFTFANYR